MNKLLLALTLFSILIYQAPKAFAQGAIVGVPTDIAVFVDNFKTGPLNKPSSESLHSYQDFKYIYGDSLAVYQYFANGGTSAYAIRSTDLEVSLDALDRIDLWNILVLPSLSQLEEKVARSVRIKAVKKVEERNAFFIVDPPQNLSPTEVKSWRDGATELAGKSHIAVYYPEVLVTDPLTNNKVYISPSAVVAARFAVTDLNVGVWISPAGPTWGALAVNGTRVPLTSSDLYDLQNSNIGIAINPIRSLPMYGSAIWGARHGDSNSNTPYISNQRLVSYIEDSILLSLSWTSYWPATPTLMQGVSAMTSGFLLNLWAQGGLFGSSPAQAFQVICDSTNNTPEDLSSGKLNLRLRLAISSNPNEFFESNLTLKTK